AHFWSRTDIQPDITAPARGVAQTLGDFPQIRRGAAANVVARPGRAISLNGIAQGYISDAIADMLRNEGFESAVVDLGEYRTIGRHPAGRPWRIGIRDGKDSDRINRTIELDDMALAVSGGYGTT